MKLTLLFTSIVVMAIMPAHLLGQTFQVVSPGPDNSIAETTPETTESVPTPPKFGQVNMGKTDRVLRSILGIALLGAGSYFVYGENQSWGYIPMGISAIPLATSATGICPLYYFFDWDTRKEEEKSKFSILLLPDKTALVQYTRKF
jgi:hypothetical protein